MTAILGITRLLSHAGGGLTPEGTRVTVFSRIFEVFLVLGALVGVVVVGYTVYNAYKYRRSGDDGADDADRPRLGEIPQGSGGGRKLLVSFSISAIIVISLILWTYSTLLYVEQDPPTESEDHLEVEVVGEQFNWQFVYPNGETTGTLRVPEDTPVKLVVTSDDVFHNFGIPAQRVKTDAIPGQTTETWFVADEPGTYTAKCYELCGAGHSAMTADVVVMEPRAYDRWYANTTGSSGANATENASTTTATATHA